MDKKSSLEELQPATDGPRLLLHCSHNTDHTLLPLYFGFYELLALFLTLLISSLHTAAASANPHPQVLPQNQSLLVLCSCTDTARDRIPIPKILSVSKTLAKGIKLLRAEDWKRELVPVSFCTCRSYSQELFMVTYCQQWT